MKSNLVAIIPDVHVPEQDNAAVRWVLKRIRERDPATVIFLGDLFDFKSISRFKKHPRFHQMFREEVKAGVLFVERIARALKRRQVKVKGGNHEVRLEHYLWRNAPELADIPALTVPALMQFPKRWEYHPPEEHHFYEQGVMIIHGRKFAGNVALANLRKYRCSVVQGHSHRMSCQYLCMADGEMLSSAECGTLQVKNPGYAGVTDWVHGMAWIENGVVTVEPMPGQKR